MSNRGLRIIFGVTVLFLFAGLIASVKAQGYLTQKLYLPLAFKPAELQCRFGIATRGDTLYHADPILLKKIKTGALISWAIDPPTDLNGEIRFIHVIRTGDNYDKDILTKIPTLVKKYPGATWQIGNEPDTCYEAQDCASPATYASQYYAVATKIRTMDPTARIGFGSIVQPTPIRLVYLDRVWSELVGKAGSPSQASDLIDFWSIHSFILNEVPGEWGTGIPPGTSSGDAPLLRIRIDESYKTHDAAIFEQRIRDFRTWMNVKGQRGKALWITEYGSLFPPLDPTGGPDLVNVSDANTASFMVTTFNFLRSATDPNIGMTADGNRLVQRWFWYSLNDKRDRFGGTLFDPDNGGATTVVGQAFIDYTAGLTPDNGCVP